MVCQSFLTIMPRRRKDCVEDKDPLKFSQGGKFVQRNAANARERARMRVLSKAFCKLKTTLPWVPADTKLSKLDTLRLASSYIAHLRQILKCDNTDFIHSGMVHPLNLTWPFTFNGRAFDGSKSPDDGVSQQTGNTENGQNLY